MRIEEVSPMNCSYSRVELFGTAGREEATGRGVVVDNAIGFWIHRVYQASRNELYRAFHDHSLFVRFAASEVEARGVCKLVEPCCKLNLPLVQPQLLARLPSAGRCSTRPCTQGALPSCAGPTRWTRQT